MNEDKREDFGAFWWASNGEDLEGRAFGHKLSLRRNDATGERLPAYHVFSPDATKDVGAVWNKTSRNGQPYLSGHFTMGGTKYDLSLWPRERRHDRSPAYGVLPPRENATAPVAATPEGEQTTLDDELDSEIPF